MAAKKTSNFYGNKIKKGALHERMHVAPGKKIPRSKIEANLHSAEKRHDTKAIRQDTFALNAEHFSHKKHTG